MGSLAETSFYCSSYRFRNDRADSGLCHQLKQYQLSGASRRMSDCQDGSSFPS